MLPASFAAAVPVFIATPTSAWASAGASFVPSPVIATSRPPSCSLRISAILSSGVASARKSSTPGLRGDRLRGQRVVAGDHHRADAHRAHLGEPLGHPGLDHVGQLDDAEHPGASPAARSATTSGVPPRSPIRVDGRRDLGRQCRWHPTHRGDGGAGALAHLAPLPGGGDVEPGHPGLRGERDELGGRLLPGRLGRKAVLGGAQRDDAAALRGLVGQAGQPGGRGQLGHHRTPGAGMQRGGPPVAEGDRAGLVQQQGVDVARGLDGPPGRGEHVALHEPVHPGDADGREQRADRGRDQADQQRGRARPATAARRSSRPSAAARRR